MKKNFTQQSIDEILDNFNFARVEETMRALNWKWETIDGSCYTPTQADMRKAVRGQIEKVFKERLKFVSSGGFSVFKTGKRIDVFFSVAEYDNEWILGKVK